MKTRRQGILVMDGGIDPLWGVVGPIKSHCAETHHPLFVPVNYLGVIGAWV